MKQRKSAVPKDAALAKHCASLVFKNELGHTASGLENHDLDLVTVVVVAEGSVGTSPADAGLSPVVEALTRRPMH